MNREELLRKLEERLARGEISEKTYLEIKRRYESSGGGMGGKGGRGVVIEIPEIEIPHVHIRVPHVVEDGSRLIVAGGGHIDGDVKNEYCKVAGSCTIDGGVETDEWKSAGSVKIKGNLKADTVRCAGSMVVEGDVDADTFIPAGWCMIGGRLTADMVKFGGSLVCKKGIKCDTLEGSGTISTPGVSAEIVVLDLEGKSDIERVTAESVEIRSGERFFSRGGLSSEQIMGNTLFIENTTCRMVSGGHVTIGPNCIVDVVEFSSRLKVHLSSKVKKKVKRDTDG
jgi:cytoskeletal protein CcmA (bactofilin family)